MVDKKPLVLYSGGIQEIRSGDLIPLANIPQILTGKDADTVDGYHHNQSLLTTASPTFAGLTLSGLTNGSVLFAGPGGVISQNNANLFWDNINNRLGIGIVSPSQKLTVAGNIGLQAGDDVFIGTLDNYALSLRTGGSDRVFINSAGNVGIGTTSPLAKLDIVPSSSSDVVFRTRSLQSTAPLGSELVSNGNFSTVPDTSWTWGTGWVHDTTNFEADHTTGNTAPLTQNIDVINGQIYHIEITIKNGTAGSVTLDINGVYIYSYGSSTALDSNITYVRSLVANTTGTATLRITPTSDFNGSVDNISVRQIIGISQPNLSLLDDAGSVMAELRGKRSLSNIALGVGALYFNTTGNHNSAIGAGALYFNTTGNYNSAIGVGALYFNTTGNHNSAIGVGALYSNTTGYNNSAIGVVALNFNTTGYNNSAIGVVALYSNTTGNYNSAIGVGALRNNTTGYNNSAIGVSALRNNTTGYNNSAIGVSAGRYISGGGDNQTSNNSVYLGYDTMALADGDTNEIVIGASAVGAGSNSVVLGNDSITKTLLKGNVGIGTTAPNYRCHVNGTFGFAPGSSVTPVNNGDVVIEATNNTTLTFKLKGSDGVVRTGTITLV